MEQTGVVPIATIFAAVETTLRVGDESEGIDLAKTADERRCCEFPPRRLFCSRPRSCPVEFYRFDVLAQERGLLLPPLLHESHRLLLLPMLSCQLAGKGEHGVCQ